MTHSTNTSWCAEIVFVKKGTIANLLHMRRCWFAHSHCTYTAQTTTRTFMRNAKHWIVSHLPNWNDLRINCASIWTRKSLKQTCAFLFIYTLAQTMSPPRISLVPHQGANDRKFNNQQPLGGCAHRYTHPGTHINCKNKDNQIHVCVVAF